MGKQLLDGRDKFSLEEKFARCDFDIQSLVVWNMVLYPPVWALQSLERSRPK